MSPRSPHTGEVAPSPSWGPVPSGTRWGSGRWSLDRRSDELADICCDGRLVLRGVRAVARDADWQTAPAHVTGVEAGPSTLTIALECSERGIDLLGTVRVDAGGDRLIVTFEGEARSDSLTNRAGLVVLHPPRLAGAGLTVGRTNGSEQRMTFPIAISPHQPARDIAALTWEDHGATFQVEFDGDVFEMEDQRNWSDASYKTYNRSLDEPFPYTIAAGERILQQVVLTADGPTVSAEMPPDPTRRSSSSPTTSSALLGSAASDAPPERWPAAESERTEVLSLEAGGAFPDIVIGASTAPGSGPTWTGAARPDLHVELDLSDPAWPAALDRARREAGGLSVMLVSPSPADPAALQEVITALSDVPLRWVGIVDAASHVSEPDLVDALRERVPSGAIVVGGSRSHFTELNREWDRLPHARLEGLTFPITPLFHTLETEQLVESLAMQRVIAENATSLAAGVPVHIGPVTLRPRFNNVATTASPRPTRSDLALGYGAERTSRTDPRQATPEFATWVVASAAALAVPGIASLTYAEDWGPRGLRTADGERLPVHEAVSALRTLQGRELLTAASSDGTLWVIGARDSERQDLLIANVSVRTRQVPLELDGRPNLLLEIAPMSWRRA
ncbi:MAG: hypothetical protein ACTMII_01900 [Brachybacterium sp.]